MLLKEYIEIKKFKSDVNLLTIVEIFKVLCYYQSEIGHTILPIEQVINITMISPQSISVATAASVLAGAEGKILEKTIKFCAGYVIVFGILVYSGSLIIHLTAVNQV